MKVNKENKQVIKIESEDADKVAVDCAIEMSMGLCVLCGEELEDIYIKATKHNYKKKVDIFVCGGCLPTVSEAMVSNII